MTANLSVMRRGAGLLVLGSALAIGPPILGEPTSAWHQLASAQGLTRLESALGGMASVALMAVGVWIAAIGVLTVAAARAHRGARPWLARVAPTALVTWATLGALGAAAVPASAAETEPSTPGDDESTDQDMTVPSLLLHDIGAAEPNDDTGQPTDDASAAQDPADDDPAQGDRAHQDPADDQWTVQCGDHLWHIATETLRDRGRPTDPASVDGYWRRLIEANRHVVGEDPDLVHPGEIITLPR